MVGLGRMGAGMTDRLRARGVEVVGFDLAPDRRDVASLDELVAALEPPRAIWVMLPSGPPTDATVRRLAELLQAGDVVVNGANDHFRHDQELAAGLAERGIAYVDAGVSGGVWGVTEGYGLMVGGPEEQVARLTPVWQALAPQGGFVHAGPVGAGHYTKMVHNGVEYALMQAYAEGYELLAASDLGIDVPGALGAWRHGTVIRSWLLDLLVRALEEDPALANIRGWADDTGEGRWTVEEAVHLAVPAPAISAALFARFASRQTDSPAMKVVAALRQQFGGHPVRRS